MELRKEPTFVKESGHTMRPKWVSRFSMHVAKNKYWPPNLEKHLPDLGRKKESVQFIKFFVTFCDSKYGLKWVWSKGFAESGRELVDLVAIVMLVFTK